MADRMTFAQLFNHMEKYIELPAERWKLVTRVKRGISDPNSRGCYSRDQSYFEGAVEILQNIDSVDFVLLMSGKLCLDELETVKRLARLDQLKLPAFIKNLKTYKDKLRRIGVVNGIYDENCMNLFRLDRDKRVLEQFLNLRIFYIQFAKRFPEPS